MYTVCICQYGNENQIDQIDTRNSLYRGKFPTELGIQPLKT